MDNRRNCYFALDLTLTGKGQAFIHSVSWICISDWYSIGYVFAYYWYILETSGTVLLCSRDRNYISMECHQGPTLVGCLVHLCLVILEVLRGLCPQTPPWAAVRALHLGAPESLRAKASERLPWGAAPVDILGTLSRSWACHSFSLVRQHNSESHAEVHGLYSRHSSQPSCAPRLTLPAALRKSLWPPCSAEEMGLGRAAKPRPGWGPVCCLWSPCS